MSDNFKKEVEYIIRKAAGNSAEVEHIEDWGTGALNKCYCIKTKNGMGKFFLKIENEGIIPSTRRGQIEREVNGIKLMRSVGIPCPEVIQYDSTGCDLGKKYMLQNFIEGELLWEVKDSLSEEENEALKSEIIEVVEKMKKVQSTCFGDIYEKGVIGQHSAWKQAYMSMWDTLMEDSVGLKLFNFGELTFLQELKEFGSSHITEKFSAGFMHGDLGKHNILVKTVDGRRGIGTVIDFGNAMFGPCYMNEDGVRKYGGWGLDSLDVCERYKISSIEYDVNELILHLEGTVFMGMLSNSKGRDSRGFAERFINQCKNIYK